ncbi:MAG: hypothetical protein K0R39_4552 [Symbiobacteriaceae bacterium]|jgi:hypothetical protein|nr:hypothetical protein [Symbiobacteriaceae bacterium]
MRHVRLLGLMIVLLAAVVIVPAASAKHGSHAKAADRVKESADLIAPSCADGCPPGPRPTMY